MGIIGLATDRDSMRSCRRVRDRRQRGSMAVAMLLLLLGLVSMLGLIEVGYLYWAKRETQKVADLAALAGAQQLQHCAPGNTDNQAARGNAIQDNGFGGELTVHCGRWDPGNKTTDHFIYGTDAPNAVKVTAAVGTVPLLHSNGEGGLTIESRAVATAAQPVAVFSTGSQLLELNDSGLVPGVLKQLSLDAGGTSLAGYKGLAGLNITPAGLLKELGVDVDGSIDVGTLNSLLAAQHISIGTLLTAVANIGRQQHLTQVALAALDGLIQAQANVQGGQLVQLGTLDDDGPRGLFAAIDAADGQSALNARVNALDLVDVGLEVANSGHFVDQAAVLPGVSTSIAIIEPPSIAIGGVGTTAHTSQVRVGIVVDTDAIPILGALLKALATTIKLPVIIDVIDGKAVLDGLCESDAEGNKTATVAVQASLLNVCVGKFDKGLVASTHQSCEDGLQDETLVSVLGAPLIRTNMHIPALTGRGDLVLHQGETGSVHAELDLGNAVAAVVKNLMLLLLGRTIDGNTPTPDISTMADQLWAQAGSQPDSPAGRKERMVAVQAMLQRPVAPETIGLLPALGNLVGGLLDSVGGLLGGVLGAVTGDGCTTGLLGLPGGSAAGCKAVIRNTLGHTQTNAGGSPIANALLGTVAQLLDVLRPVLNGIGEQVLQPTLKSLLGEEPGRVDVHLQSLQCHRVRLVY